MHYQKTKRGEQEFLDPQIFASIRLSETDETLWYPRAIDVHHALFHLGMKINAPEEKEADLVLSLKESEAKHPDKQCRHTEQPFGNPFPADSPAANPSDIPFKADPVLVIRHDVRCQRISRLISLLRASLPHTSKTLTTCERHTLVLILSRLSIWGPIHRLQFSNIRDCIDRIITLIPDSQVDEEQKVLSETNDHTTLSFVPVLHSIAWALLQFVQKKKHLQSRSLTLLYTPSNKGDIVFRMTGFAALKQMCQEMVLLYT